MLIIIKTSIITLFMTLSLIVPSNLFSVSNIKEKNDILNFALNKILSVENSDNRDFYLSHIFNFYLQSGDIESCYSIIEKMREGYSIYSVLINFINEEQRLSQSEFIKLRVLVGTRSKGLDNHTRFSLFSQLLYACVRRGDKTSAEEIFGKLEKMRMRENIDFFDQLKLLSKIYEIKSGRDLARELLKKDGQKKLYNKRNDYFPIHAILKEIYTKSPDSSRISSLLTKIESNFLKRKSPDQNTLLTLDIIEKLIHSGKFSHIESLYRLFIQKIRIMPAQGKRREFLITLLERGEKNKVIQSILQNDPEVKDLFLSEIGFKKKSPYKIRDYKHYALTEKTIQFLVNSGAISQARDIAETNRHTVFEAEMLSPVEFLDIYYYYLARKYLENRMPEKAAQYARRINSSAEYKIKLLLQIAEYWGTISRFDALVETLEEAAKVKVDFNPYGSEKERLFGKIIRTFLKFGLIKHAIKYFSKLTVKDAKNNLLFDISQVLIARGRYLDAKLLVKKVSPTQEIEGYILSKIASRRLVSGNPGEASELFKKALEKVLSTEYGDLRIVLNDYYHALKYDSVRVIIGELGLDY